MHGGVCGAIGECAGVWGGAWGGSVSAKIDTIQDSFARTSAWVRTCVCGACARCTRACMRVRCMGACMRAREHVCVGMCVHAYLFCV